jgi:hypothetical protein
MMKALKLFVTVLAAGTILAGLSLPVMAASQVSDQMMLQEQTRLIKQIRQDTGMAQAEVDAMRLELRNAMRSAGGSEPVRAMVRTAHAEGCQGECLRETVRLMTRTMDQGLTAEEAQNMIRKEVRNCVRERSETGMSESEMCQKLHLRMEERIQARLRTSQDTSSGAGRDRNSRSGGSGGRK